MEGTMEYSAIPAGESALCRAALLSLYDVTRQSRFPAAPPECLLTAPCCRPYLYTALAAGAVGLPFVLVKAVRLHDSTPARMHWTSHLTIYATNAG